MRKIIDLYPEAPNEWVYRDHDDDLLPDGTPRRQFEPSVTIPLSDLDLWHECTDQQRRDWEEQHPDPEPEVSPDGEIEEAAATAETGETPDGKGASDQPANDPADPANEGKEAEV